MTNPPIHLAKDFPASSEQQWRGIADKALRGANFESTLVKHSEDGLVLGPLFNRADTCVPLAKTGAPHLASRPWHIGVEIEHPDIDHANSDVLSDLKGGASALSLNLDTAGKHGIALRSKSDVQRLLSGVHTALVPIHLVPSAHNFEAAALMSAHFQTHADIENIHLSLGFVPGPDDSDKTLSLTYYIQAQAPHWKTLSVNGAALHEVGASAGQELAFMAARIVSYLKILCTRFDAETALRLIDVRLAADQDAHFNIVKFRAARMIWDKLVHEFGVSIKTAPLALHAVSSVRMLTKNDPWPNILRLNSACFGAVCGGANMITLVPFTRPLGLATSFARRVSRNIQLLHMEETRLGHVHDPAHGSYMHETLSHELAKTAWELFQDIERKGGWYSARDAFMQNVKSTQKTRAEKIASGDVLLVGINQFVNPDVREAKTLPRPNIKPRKGKIIDASDFSQAIEQANEGYILPLGNTQGNE